MIVRYLMWMRRYVAWVCVALAVYLIILWWLGAKLTPDQSAWVRTQCIHQLIALTILAAIIWTARAWRDWKDELLLRAEAYRIGGGTTNVLSSDVIDIMPIEEEEEEEEEDA